MRAYLMAAAAAGAVFFSATPAQAWGETGHAAVCELAYRNLTAAARVEMRDLFKAWSARYGMEWRDTRNEELLYNRFMNACIFEDKVKQRGELARFKDQPGHFVNYGRDKARVPDGEEACSHKTDGTEVKCIFRVLDRDVAVFRDPAAAKADRAEAMLGIGHWLGDIHQPLHVSFADDQGGNAIAVKGPCGSTNLHSVWDKCLVIKGIWDPLRKAQSLHQTGNPRTIAYRIVDKWRSEELSAETKADVARWIVQDKPWQWAQESYDKTLAVEPETAALPLFTANGYCWKRAGRCDYSETQADLPRGGSERRTTLPDDYVTRFAPVAERRLRQAGYRLAWLINSTLDPAWNRSLPTCSVTLGTCPT